MMGSSAVYRISGEDKGLGGPIFDDPSWHEVDATTLAARPQPMGHMSAISPAKKRGTILCLDVNFTRPAATASAPVAKAERVRVLASSCRGECHPLGEITLQADGSFMAEVPADTPIGFEALSADGQVLRRLPPSLWVRPGENRSCVGCHQPHNRSPRNVRPLAVKIPAVVLDDKPKTVAQHSP